MIGRAHPLLSTTACVRNASRRVFRLTVAPWSEARPTVAGQRRTWTGFPHHGRHWDVISGSIALRPDAETIVFAWWSAAPTRHLPGGVARLERLVRQVLTRGATRQ
jgi:hypothetical protein